jgi:hypothetical protein
MNSELKRWLLRVAGIAALLAVVALSGFSYAQQHVYSDDFSGAAHTRGVRPTATEQPLGRERPDGGRPQEGRENAGRTPQPSPCG